MELHAHAFMKEFVQIGAGEVGIGFFQRGESGKRLGSVIVSRVNHCGVGKFQDGVIEAFVHLFGVPAGKVASPAAVDEKGVACDEEIRNPEALAPRRVAGGEDAFNGDVSNG